MDLHLQIDHGLFDRVFPFSFILDQEMKLVHAGKSLLKLKNDIIGQSFLATFTIKRPRSATPSFNTLLDFSDQIFLLEVNLATQSLTLRGQMVAFSDHQLAFLGSPWFNNIDDVQKHGLNFSDYALHDSVPDMLQFLKLKDIATKDTQQLNERLEVSEHRYRELVERGSAIIFKLDATGKVLFLNEVAARKLEYNKMDALGQHYSAFIPQNYTDEIASGFNKLLTRESSNKHLEYPLKTATGKIIWFSQQTQVILNKNGKKEIRAFAQDITERIEIEQNLKSTELRLSNLIANLQSGILVEDQNQRIVLTNPLFCDLFNIQSPPAELIGTNYAEVTERSKYLFEDPDHFLQDIEEIIQEQKTRAGEEVRMKDGRILERDYIPIYSSGTYLGHLWQYRDLTEKKLVEKELIRARQEAEAAQEAEKQFLAHMSHEIRTPLNAIIGMLHLLMSTELTEEQRSFLEIQKNSTDILYGLINDILEISKIEAGGLKVDERKINLNALMESQYKTFKHQLFERPLEIRWQPNKDLDEYLLGDELLLNQVLINLIGNAVKFTETGFIDIQAELLDKKDHHWHIKFSVCDTGIGIPDEKLQLIFERFKQADENTSIRYGGTGLGLAITKQIIELLGGNIEVHTQLGIGSTFAFTLILKGSGEKIVQQDKHEATWKSTLSRTGMQFLVAEDNAVNTFYLKSIFSKLDVEVDYTPNGLECWRKAQEKEYDLILMDIRMPEMNGLIATKKIRNEKNKNQQTPILALTASAFQAQVERAINAGSSDFLPKPFTPDQLMRKIQSLTDPSNTILLPEAPDESSSGEFDPQSFADLYDGDLEMAQEIYELFQEENIPLFEEIETLIQSNDFSEARKVIHKIKPSFSMIGLPKIHESMDFLEARCEEEAADAGVLYQEIKMDLKEKLLAVEKFLGST